MEGQAAAPGTSRVLQGRLGLAWAPARGPSRRKRRQPWASRTTTTRTEQQSTSIRLRVIFSHHPSSLPLLLFPSFLYVFLNFRPLPLFLRLYPLHRAQRALLHNSSLPSRHSTPQPHRTFVIAQNFAERRTEQLFRDFSDSTRAATSKITLELSSARISQITNTGKDLDLQIYPSSPPSSAHPSRQVILRLPIGQRRHLSAGEIRYRKPLDSATRVELPIREIFPSSWKRTWARERRYFSLRAW
jgi:hypothetical protein